MSHRFLLPGRVYKFLYPATNLTCLRFICPMRERMLLVSRVRDTLAEPLDEETLTMHPYTNRGRWLVTGIDLEKFEERSFYVESMIAVLEIRVDIPNSSREAGLKATSSPSFDVTAGREYRHKRSFFENSPISRISKE